MHAFVAANNLVHDVITDTNVPAELDTSSGIPASRIAFTIRLMVKLKKAVPFV